MTVHLMHFSKPLAWAAPKPSWFFVYYNLWFWEQINYSYAIYFKAMMVCGVFTPMDKHEIDQCPDSDVKGFNC